MEKRLLENPTQQRPRRVHVSYPQATPFPSTSVMIHAANVVVHFKLLPQIFRSYGRTQTRFSSLTRAIQPLFRRLRRFAGRGRAIRAAREDSQNSRQDNKQNNRTDKHPADHHGGERALYLAADTG